MDEWVAVVRDPRFSPLSVEKDRAILQAVADRLGGAQMVEEQRLTTLAKEVFAQTDFFLSMGRMTDTLAFLDEKRREGARVINNPQGVAQCARGRLREVMDCLGMPVPPASGAHGHWVKRGDAAAQRADDVVFVPPDASIQDRADAFARRGVTDVVVEAHIPGDVVKFYGVESTGFFRIFYPTDDGLTKFGLEKVNGPAHHYAFDAEALQQAVENVARFLDVPIYGGDAIITSEGRFFVIDFNDWPSFGRCLNEAADAIASLAGRIMNNKKQ